jgi:ADP-ribosylation factor-like protein 2
LRILVLGLDNAGKTTVVRRLLGQPIDKIQPTLGFSIQTLTYRRRHGNNDDDSLRLHLWDIGGQKTIRSYWRNYFDGQIDGIIWVVDSIDNERSQDMAEELDRILQHERLRSSTLLLLANKQDVIGAVSVETLAQLLPDRAKERRHWKIFACSAVTGQGLVEAVDWLVEDISSRIFLLS